MNDFSVDDENKNVGSRGYLVKQKKQIRLKYVVNLEAKKTVVYPGVPDVLMALTDQVKVFVLSLRSEAEWKDTSDPYNEILMHAKLLYEGSHIPQSNQCTHLNLSRYDISIIGIVICHNIWKGYEKRRKDMLELNGKEIWGYHETDRIEVTSIAMENLDPKRRPGCIFDIQVVY